MSIVKPETAPEELVYIDLDEPVPWWSTLVGVVAIVLIALVLIAPWVISLEDDQPNTVANSTLQNTSTVCRPDSSGLPNILDPSVASWSRFCEWFIAPELNPRGD